MTQAISQTYNAVGDNRKAIIFAMFAVCVFLAALYVVYVYRVISNTVAVSNIQKEAAVISANVDDLDKQYLDLSSKITPDNLKAYGLSEGSVSAYISRSTSLGSVALGGNEL